MSDWSVASKDRLSELVASQIRDAIRSGRLKPGDRLIESALAERLDVSKTPVREAIRDLERQGLVQQHPRRGSFVRSMTVQDLREIRTLRATLEGLAMRLGMEQGNTEPWIEELQSLIVQIRESSSSSDMNELHVQFHVALSSRSQNGRLDEMLASLQAQTRIFLSFVHLLYEGPGEIADEHLEFIDVIRSENPTLVQPLLGRHILEDGAHLEAIWSSQTTELSEATT